MLPQAVTLDAGGTLLREEPSRAEIYAQAARQRGLEVTESAMSHWMHRTHEELPLEVNGGFRYSDPWFRAFIERIFCGHLGLQQALLAGVQRDLFERFSKPETFRLFPGARELMTFLRDRDVRVGIISNWGPALSSVLAGLGVRDLADGIWISAAERVEKPDEEIFHRACEGLNAEPARALHAGDHPEKDFRAARSAGLEAVLIDRADRLRGFEGSRVHSLGELQALLQRRCHDRN